MPIRHHRIDSGVNRIHWSPHAATMSAAAPHAAVIATPRSTSFIRHRRLTV
jgi:hypothetical protein